MASKIIYTLGSKTYYAPRHGLESPCCAHRWRECHSGYGSKEFLPVALIPIEWFGTLELINYAFKTWEAIQGSLKVIVAIDTQQKEARN